MPRVRRKSQGDPPYAQIANDLRARIASGRLGPGARVPSTRQIGRDWGVALATAGRALSALCREGLILSVPRSGYLVSTHAHGAGAPGARTPPLTRERIVQAAVRLADQEGLVALSMRGVAAKLDVPTMSLYRYVDGKDALVLAMIDAVFAAAPAPPRHGGDLRAVLTWAARAQWALYKRHGWLAHVMPLTRPVALPQVMTYAEVIFAAMEAPGVAAATRLEAHMTLYNYVRGVAVNLESEREAEAHTGVTETEWNDAQGAALAALASSGAYPAFGRLLEELKSGYDLDLDRVFEVGLGSMIDGVVKRLRPKKG